MRGGVEMKKTWIFIVVVLSVLSVLTGCIRKPMDNTQNSDKLYLGYNPLPREFLEFWFENIEKIRSGELDPIKFSSDSKLPASSKQIADTQIIFTEPPTDSLPPYYVAPHTSPKYQGENGTCWAFATAGALESALLTQLSYSERTSMYPFLDPGNPDLSEQFIAYYNLSPFDESNPYQITVQESNKDTGGNAFFSTFNLIRRGVPEEEDFPYIPEKQGWIKWKPENDNWKYNLVRPYRTVCIPDFYYHRAVYQDYTAYINTIKSTIMQYGAVAAAFMFYEDFYSYWWEEKGKVYIKSPSASSNGGHAVLIVGWVDDYYDSVSGYSGPIWVIKNSWGTDGGFSLNDYGLSSDTTRGYFALPMITEQEYNGTCPDWKIEYSPMYVPILEVEQKNYTIQADNEVHTVGRVSYIDVKVVDDKGSPVPGVRVKFFYQSPSDGDWSPVVDELTKQDEAITNSNGIATMAVIGNIQIDNQKFYAYVVENPSSQAYFTVTFQKPNWLFMIWMCADNDPENDLENFALSDLKEIENTNENVSVITFFDGKANPDCVYFLDEFGEQKEIYTFDEDLDSGNHLFLLGGMNLTFGVFESSNRALILWDHGDAWLYDGDSMRSQYSPKAICYDYTSENSISVAELRAVFESYTGPSVDLLAMDACLMGSIEVLYELKDVVDYVVASSFTESGNGYDYSFLRQIDSNDSALDVGKKIVDTYKQFYDGSTWENLGLSLAVYDMNEVQSTAEYISSLGFELKYLMDDNLRSNINNFYPSLIQYYYDNSNNPIPLLVDLNNCAQLMKSYISDSAVQDYAQQIQDALDQLVVYEYAERTSYGQINNPVSIFMPNNPYLVTDLANDYNTLLFPAELFWSDFLEAWLQTGDVLRGK